MPDEEIVAGNRLTFIENVEKIKYYHQQAMYRCTCGNTTVVRIDHVNKNTVRSCGCLQKEIVSGRFKTHGFSGTKEHAIWKSIIQRCINPRNASYKNYGQKGITICEEWRNSFEAFFRDMGTKPEKMSIDRIDNTRSYSKDNCKWSTNKEQQNNKSSNRILILNGRSQNLQEWANELGMNHKMLRRRVRLGWTDVAVLTTLKRERHERISNFI